MIKKKKKLKERFLETGPSRFFEIENENKETWNWKWWFLSCNLDSFNLLFKEYNKWGKNKRKKYIYINQNWKWRN